jgi:predicted HAD superfamily Cof-like phosphohydrolase
MTNFEKVKEFHDKYKIGLGWNHPTFLPADEALNRIRLMTEELAEVVKAIAKKDMVNLAKELADMLYVVYGTADEYGIPMDTVFSAVHASNMTKSTEKDESGKILKGDNYVEPDIEGVLNDR